MRPLTLATAFAILATAGAAHAADVSVSVGPELQRHTDAYGQREVDRLSKDLAETVQRALAKPGAAPVARVDLVLQSATPNRPTFNQLSAESGLSLSSVGIGGAAITGTVTGADGATHPISYRWRETDITFVTGYTTWTDAQRAFDGLASSLARGKTPDQGAYRPDLTGHAAFDERGRFN